jgi:hypothetical protein
MRASSRRGAPAPPAPPLLPLLLLLAAAAAPAAAQPWPYEWEMLGAYDNDTLWNDQFGAGAWVYRLPNATKADWTEGPQWAAPGVGPQLQWWNARTRERGGAPRGVGGGSLRLGSAGFGTLPRARRGSGPRLTQGSSSLARRSARRQLRQPAPSMAAPAPAPPPKPPANLSTADPSARRTPVASCSLAFKQVCAPVLLSPPQKPHLLFPQLAVLLRGLHKC